MKKCDDDLAFENGLDSLHLIARIQVSIVDNNNEIVMNFAPGGWECWFFFCSFSMYFVILRFVVKIKYSEIITFL